VVEPAGIPVVERVVSSCSAVPSYVVSTVTASAALLPEAWVVPAPTPARTPLPANEPRPTVAVEDVPVPATVRGRAVAVSTPIARVVVEVVPTSTVASLCTWPRPATMNRSGAWSVFVAAAARETPSRSVPSV
jgi:hypothetical protein